MKKPLNASELRSHLAHYMGSQQVFHLPMRWDIVYTEGVRYFAQNAGNGAYWFLTILITEPAILKQAEDFASIKLLVDGTQATITVDDGRANPPVFVRHIDFTDCPEGEWKFYFTDRTIMLTSEY